MATGRGAGMTVPAWITSGNAPGGLSSSQVSRPPAPAPTPPAKPPSTEWQEFSTPEGRKYFYNKVTKTTTWEKPDELKTNDELAVKSCPWKEYTSDTGRKYFYNHITHTSSWEIPAELAALKEGAEAPKGVDSPKIVQASEQAINKSSVVYASKKEAVQAFKDMLAAVGVRSNWSWETALNHIANDPRYAALTSLGDKKQAFAEYCQQRKKYEDEDRRKRDRQVKDDFVEMLRTNKELTSRLSWRKAQPLFENDARYQAVDDKDKELLFEEYLYELEKTERDEEQRARKDAMVKFKTALESNPTITVKTQWRKLKESLADDPLFSTMDKLDSLTVFDNHIRDLEKKEAELQRSDRDRLRRDSRKGRDAFRELLTEKFNANELSLKTKWREFVKTINSDPRYTNMFTTTGSTPQELFSDFLEDFEEVLDKDKRVLREIMKERDFNFTLNTTFEEFQSSLASHDRFLTIQPKHLTHLYEDQVEKAEIKEQGNIKRRKKLASAFKDYMKTVKDIVPTSTWIDARPLLMSSKEFDAVDDEQEREKTFNEYIAYIARKQKEKEEKKEKEREKEREKEKDRSRRDKDRDRHSSEDETEEGEEREERSTKKHHKDKKKDKKKKHHRSKDDDDKKKKRRSVSDDEHRSPKKHKKERSSDSRRLGKHEHEHEEDEVKVKREDGGEVKREDEVKREEGEVSHSEEGEVRIEEKEEGETDQDSPMKHKSTEVKLEDKVMTEADA